MPRPCPSKDAKRDKALPSYQAPAVQKAFHLLETVAEAEEGMQLTELSEQLGISKSTTHGLIQALLKVGALVQSPHQKRVFLGASLVNLASKSSHYFRITKKLQPMMDGLRDGIGHTVFLGVLNESRGTIITTSKPHRSLSIACSPGSTIPLMAGAVGKAFLASMSNREALKIIHKKGLKPYTPNTIVDKKAYLEELKWVRRIGYAVDDEEYLAGVKAVAVNLGNYRNLPMLICVVGFSSTMTRALLPGIVEKTMDAAHRIKETLEQNNPP